MNPQNQMKKKDIQKLIRFQCVCLFKDDLEAICKILEECKLQYNIDLDEYQICSTDFNSISEVDLKHKKYYKVIRVNARKEGEYNSFITLTASGLSVIIDYYESNIISIAVAYKLKEILEKRVRKLAYLNNPAILVLLGFMPLILETAGITTNEVELLFIAAMIIFLLLAPTLSKSLEVVFIPENSSTKRGLYKYFSRSKDEIFAQIISNSVILIIGFLLGRLTE